jgi:hypothetical protein
MAVGLLPPLYDDDRTPSGDSGMVVGLLPPPLTVTMATQLWASSLPSDGGGTD